MKGLKYLIFYGGMVGLAMSFSALAHQEKPEKENKVEAAQEEYQNFIELWDKLDGRPAALYQLTMSKSPVCQKILEGLNVYSPRVRSELFGYSGPNYSDRFLKSPNSINWQEYKKGYAKYLYAQLDVNSDGKKEWVIQEAVSSGGYWHEYLYWTSGNINHLAKIQDLNIYPLKGDVIKYQDPLRQDRFHNIFENQIEPACNTTGGCHSDIRSLIPVKSMYADLHLIGNQVYLVRANFPVRPSMNSSPPFTESNPRDILINVQTIRSKHSGDMVCTIQSKQKYIGLGL